ncbi:acyltransferase family protein [Furfurilactobacillus entadae]|uniref:acyltransferase family protein n=1 Tax=Furfurilactobacillus entadae TaxID=2922307 RepID=UPI0035F0CDE9
MQATPTPAKRRYITGINGLRTLAVLGVIAYHLLPALLPGGFLGVPIFLALTGYLVTDQFLEQLHRGERLAVGQFYRRRVGRLLPALFTMLVATSAYITVCARQLLPGLKATLVTNLLSVYNWFEIGHGQSYFDRFNGESPFTHLWTLSIEGQFYLIWPLVIIILVRLVKRRARIAGTLTLLGIISAVLMAVLFSGSASINRIYYGTDTRAFSLLFGGALAAIWPSAHLNANLGTNGRRVLNWLGGVSLAVMVLMYWQLSGTAALTYHGGMALFSVMTTGLLAVVVHPGASWNRWLTNPVFTWIGQRSYGLYLYQFPVMIFYEQRVVNVADHSWLNALAELALILILTEVSYRFIEQPLAHVEWATVWQTLRTPQQWAKQPVARLVTSAVVGVLTLVTVIGAIQASTTAKQRVDAVTKHIQTAGKQTKQKNRQVADDKAALASSAAHQQKDNAAAKKQLSAKQQALTKTYGLEPTAVLAAQQTSITAIGDSVLVDTADDLQQVFGHAYVDAQVGRQVWQAPGTIETLKKRHLLAQTVLINLGTNAPLTQAQIDDVVKAVGANHTIYWVNTMVPTKNWQDQVNTLLAQNAKQRQHFYVIDWYSLSHAQPAWFGPDHVHPDPAGSAAYTRLVVQTITAKAK